MKNSILILFLSTSLFLSCENEKTVPEKDNQRQTVSSYSDKVEIIDPWIRPASSGSNTALFFKVVNLTETDDTLFSASSDLARKVEVHETYQAENNMMGMRHVDFVVIPKGDTVVFKPRDFHVMLMKVNNDIVIGDTGTAVLIFKNSGEIPLRATVRDMPKIM